MPTIGKVRVDLEGNTSHFNRSMRRSADRLEGLRRRFSAFRASILPLAGAFGFGRLIQSTVAEAERMQQLSDRIGTNVTQFSRLARVLSRAGIRLDATGTILQRLQRRAQEAREGNKQLAEIFERLGINVDNFVKLDPVEAFLQFGEALNRASTSAEKLFLAVKVLDTEGAQVLQANLGTLREELAKTTAITDKQAASATRLRESWAKFGEGVRSLALSFAEKTGFTTFLGNLGEIASAAASGRPANLQRDPLLDRLFAPHERAMERVQQSQHQRPGGLLTPGPGFITNVPEAVSPLQQQAPRRGLIGGGQGRTFGNQPELQTPSISFNAGRVIAGGNLEVSNRILEQLRGIRRNTEQAGAILE